jgi:antirestriction protein ArdC/phage/plasmid primase-like uncharacterized protein/Mor family transcriptional regulator
MEKKPHHIKVAENLIKKIEEGTAPWQRPWKPGQVGMLPMNPVTNKRYKGINALHLMSQEHSDPRWLTYNQAQDIGAQVRKGEKGTTVQYWKFTEERDKIDPQSGEVVTGPDGKAIKEIVKLDSPRVFLATVFNASQIDNIPEISLPPRDQWQDLERAEHILKASGANISHKDQNTAYYRPSTDSIHLPLKEQFETPANYYATALHEVGHWSGHPSRLARDLSNPFGSEAYAKEELRAEIASMVLGDELGIGHDPGQHAAYVKSWVKALKDDPMEIFRAAADAEKIVGFVMAFEQQQVIDQVTSLDETHLTAQQMKQLGITELTNIDTYLTKKVHEIAEGQRNDMVGEWPGLAESFVQDLKKYAKNNGFDADLRFVDAEFGQIDAVKLEYRQGGMLMPFQSVINLLNNTCVTMFDGKEALPKAGISSDLSGQLDALAEAIEMYQKQAKVAEVSAAVQQARVREFIGVDGEGALDTKEDDAITTWNNIKACADRFSLIPYMDKDPETGKMTVFFADSDGFTPAAAELNQDTGRIERVSYNTQPVESLELALATASNAQEKLLKRIDPVLPTLHELTAEEAMFGEEEKGHWVIRDHNGFDMSASFKDFGEAKAARDAISEGAKAMLLLQEGLISESQFIADFSERVGVTLQEPKLWAGTARVDLIKTNSDGSVSVATDEDATAFGLFANKLTGEKELIGQFDNKPEAALVSLKLSQISGLLDVMQGQLHQQIQPKLEKAAEAMKMEPQQPIQTSASLKIKSGITYLQVPYKEKAQVKDLGAKWDGKKNAWYVPAGLPLEPFTKWMNAAAVAVPDNVGQQERKESKTFIAVPYAEKDAAKKAGAKWDNDAKSWYVPEGADLTPFRKFMVDESAPAQKLPKLSPKEDLAVLLRSIGAVVDDPNDLILSPKGVILQGKDTRLQAKDDKPTEYSIFYRAWESDGSPGDVPAGLAMNNRTGEKVTWTYKGYNVSAEDRAIAQAKAAETKQQREQQLSALHTKMATHLLEFFSACGQTTEQEQYLVNKGVDGKHLRVVPAEIELSADSPIKIGKNFTHSKQLREADPSAVVFTAGELLVPAHDAQNTLWSVQAIQPNGSKRFASGGKKTGNFLALNELASADLIIIGEGYATLKSLEKVPVDAKLAFVSAFDSGNLSSVAATIRAVHPDKPILFAGDDDHHQTLKEIPKPNVGKEKALSAAAAVGNASAFFPVFASGEAEAGLTDFNDLERKSSLGMDGLTRQFQFAVNQALVKAQEHSKEIKQRQEEKLVQTREKKLTQSRPMARTM